VSSEVQIPRRRVVVTGADGFLGSHLVNRLRREPVCDVVAVGRAGFSGEVLLASAVRGSAAVIHCAGINRGEPGTVENGNIELASALIAALETGGARPALLYTSSIQEKLDNPYGRGKAEAGRRLRDWAQRAGAGFTTLVIPNIFGDRGRPFYNSVVATFCHQLALGETPKIIEDRIVPLVYVQHVVDSVVRWLLQPEERATSIELRPDTEIRVTELLAQLQAYYKCIVETGAIPAFRDEFDLNLYHTLRAYLGQARLAWQAQPRTDARGTLFEVIKQHGAGQVFFSSTHPGVIRGNHYHTRKIEKFCVIGGCATIRLRRIGTNCVTEIPVSGEAPRVVEMPIFHAHHIENTGTGELVTLFWSNEVFDPADPDTFMEEVMPKAMNVEIQRVPISARP
jgi:UDP-2-acetamido-2,6-beta-L-arabino-hexul-4-ose reductase